MTNEENSNRSRAGDWLLGASFDFYLRFVGSMAIRQEQSP